MAYAIHSDVAQDQFGNAVSGATITVYSISFGSVVSNPLPSIYSASSSIGTTPVVTSNPMTSDSMGRFSFGAPDGFYAIVVSGSTFSSYTIYKNFVASAATGSGSGTVTSVALSLPGADFAVSGSPVTGSGTLVGSYQTQTTNKVFASPNGSTGTPGFRALATNDLPNSGATAATYGSLGSTTGAFTFTAFTVDAKGRITATADTSITIPLASVQTTWTKSQNVASVPLSFATPLNTDATAGNAFHVTATSNFRLANPTGLVSGGTYLWRIAQDATGSRIITYGSMFKFAGGSAPALSTAANSVDLLTAYYDGTNLLCALNKAFA